MNFVPPPQIRIQSTRDVVLQGVKGLVYGGAGQGKTTMMATLPAPLIISAEGGLLSLRKLNLPFIAVNNMATLQAAYQFIAQSAEARQFMSIGIDSVSEIAEVCLSDEMGRTANGQKAYGEMAKLMMMVLRLFRDLPGRNVWFTAKMARTKDETTGGILWGPMMPGQQLDQQLPYLFDEMFHIGTYKDQGGQSFRALRTQPDIQFQAKDRSGALDLWEQPNLSQIIDKIMRG